jgi:hypothetical protein
MKPQSIFMRKINTNSMEVANCSAQFSEAVLYLGMMVFYGKQHFQTCCNSPQLADQPLIISLRLTPETTNPISPSTTISSTMIS